MPSKRKNTKKKGRKPLEPQHVAAIISAAGAFFVGIAALIKALK